MKGDRLACVADHVAARPTLRESLANTDSAEFLAQRMAGVAADLGLAIDRQTWRRIIDSVVQVDEPLARIKPTIDLKLGDLSAPIRIWILILWLAGNVAELFDTPTIYRPTSMIGVLLRRSATRKPSPRRAMIRDYAAARRAEMKAMYRRLDDQLWRHHVDWEDQHRGPEVYDRGLHGGRVEPGYIENSVASHHRVAACLGERLSGDIYEALHHALIQYRGDWALEFDLIPRHLWRLWDILEDGVLEEYDPRHFRRLPHRRWEVMAFKQIYKTDAEGFARKNPAIAKRFKDRYGDPPTLTPAIIDAEFMRIEFCWFDRPYDGHILMAALEAQFDSFYDTMRALDETLAQAASDSNAIDDIRHAQITEIARLHRWLENAHIFRDANTRVNELLVNKLLIEFDFTPSIIAQRCDSPFYTLARWTQMIEEGMERWNALCVFNRMGLLDHVLGFRQAPQSN